ncbi:UTRA domain-containing protein [Streptomyces sp. NBRC 109706]|uniref:UTRA domain-containing protein n=1 Tax=Streptomyces sp. NBRC 109706 TaxID=1550035 RepID=UPI000784BA81|nr:UTRA domain-containing protein [Streptomyces sp. NBRC 109706]
MAEKWTTSSAAYLRPRTHGESDTWTSAAPGRSGQQLLAVDDVAPPLEVAKLLDLAAGDSSVVRRRLILLDGEPIEIASSYYPSRIAAGTALASSKKIRGGAPTALADLGYPGTRAVEYIEQRIASDEEGALLCLAAGASVLTLTRTTYSDHTPVEASLMVMKAPRRLRYELEVQ